VFLGSQASMGERYKFNYEASTAKDRTTQQRDTDTLSALRSSRGSSSLGGAISV